MNHFLCTYYSLDGQRDFEANRVHFILEFPKDQIDGK